MNTRNLLVSVLILVCVLLSACASATATLPIPTTVPPTITPTSVTVTAVPSPASNFKLPMGISFNSDWQVAYDLPGKFAIDNSHDFGLAFYIVTDAKLADPIDGHLIPFPEDFLSWIQSNPDFHATVSMPVKIAGIDGLQIFAQPIWKSTTSHLKPFLSLSGDTSLNAHGQPDGENIVTDLEQWLFILLNNVNGERVLIILINQHGHDFQDAMSRSQEVLDSVVFAK